MTPISRPMDSAGNARKMVMEARMRRFVTAATRSSATPKRWWLKAACAGLGLALVVAAPSSASAQEIQLTGPLKGAPAVRQLRLYREGRLEIAPTVSFTLLDEY